MKIVFIPPIKFNEEFMSQGDYEFALAQFVTDENKEYVKYFQKSDRYKIIDNGAAELGKSIDMNDVLDRARKINADELWVPDKLFDSQTTISNCSKFFEMIKEKDKKITFVLIPQGKNFSTWVACLQSFIDRQEWFREQNIRTILMLSKYSVVEAFKVQTKSTQISTNRLQALEFVVANQLNWGGIHLGGADELILNEIDKAKMYSVVRSIDSNIAIKLGLNLLEVDDPAIGKIGEPTERLNFHLKELTDMQRKAINKNIKLLKEIAHNDQRQVYQ